MFTTLQKLNLLTPILLALNVSAEIDFAHEVLPILKENCVKCHSNGKKKGGLSMETRESVLDSETIAVGKAGESLFIELLTAEDEDDRMP
ncbi:hypothetical protein N9B14_06460, partial [Akkermansiaceae bacterium]|nr:hypothetical protein [Akkermansiaceae bacterium]